MPFSARNQSERIRNEAIRLMRERENKTIMTQRDADRRIGERLHDEVGDNNMDYRIIVRFYSTYCADILEVGATDRAGQESQ